VAPQLTTTTSNKSDDTERFHLYSVDMHLSCAIPEDQNTRGRRVYPPEEAPQSFGLLTVERLPEVCPFPIYTRSGEVFVRFVHLKANEILERGSHKKDLVLDFHRFTFSKVLRMEKYPMMFSPTKSDNSGLVVPLRKRSPNNGEDTNASKDVDWDFLELIASE